MTGENPNPRSGWKQSKTSTINGTINHGTGGHSAPLEKVVREAIDSMALKLDGRNIRDVPPELLTGALVDVEVADLSFNCLEEISQSLCCSLLSVNTLKCCGNRIKSISTDIDRLQHLRSVDFSCNQLSQFPEALLSCELLDVLIIRSNRLASIPSSISVLQKLSKLDVSHNELCTLPPELGDMKYLRSLSISQNALLSLPEEISKLSLRELNAEENRLSSLPIGLHNMKSLQVLRVGNNPLNKPPLHVALRGRLHIFHALKKLERQEAKKHGFLQGVPQLHENTNGGFGAAAAGGSQFERLHSTRDSGYVTSESSNSERAPSESRGNDTLRLLRSSRGGGGRASSQSHSSSQSSVHSTSSTLTDEHSTRSGGSSTSSRTTDSESESDDSPRSTAPEQTTPVQTHNSPAFVTRPAQLPTPPNRDLSAGAVLTSRRLNPAPGGSVPTARSNPRDQQQPQQPPLDHMFNSIPRRQPSNPSVKLPSPNAGLTVRRREQEIHDQRNATQSLKQILESVVDVQLEDDLCAALSDGVVLCTFINSLHPAAGITGLPNIHQRQQLSIGRRMQNATQFVEACVRLGVPKHALCSPADVYEGKNLPQVTRTVSSLLSLPK